jgi:hypothetical protein
MKVVIHQTSRYEGMLLERYPVLEKYKDDYIPLDDDFDFISDYWRGDCIIVHLNQFEIIQLVEKIMKKEKVIIQYADSYDHETYGIDIDIEMYNDMRE